MVGVLKLYLVENEVCCPQKKGSCRGSTLWITTEAL